MKFLAITLIISAVLSPAISQNWPFPTFSYPQPYSHQSYNQQYQPYIPQYSGSTQQWPYQQWPTQQNPYYPNQNSRNNPEPSENFNTAPATTATSVSFRPTQSQTISRRQNRISVESKKNIIIIL